MLVLVFWFNITLLLTFFHWPKPTKSDTQSAHGDNANTLMFTCCDFILNHLKCWKGELQSGEFVLSMTVFTEMYIKSESNWSKLHELHVHPPSWPPQAHIPPGYITPSRPASTANGGSGCKSCRIVQYNMKSELRNIPSEDERKTDR